MKLEQEVYMGDSKQNFEAGECKGDRIKTVAHRQHESVEKDRKEDEKEEGKK